jgi:chromosome segregation protein
MYLKALELNGFKSFADKTYIEFNKGITSIVGPNGSGKSNILDAILWVLGEQSYKSIRAKESSDVIFSGGKNKKAKSMAEVSLHIENSDRYLDIDFTEVKITRRIYKSGENEYLINNRKVRLKDVNSLFMDTGIGKQAYSIIGQGRVERIISSNPKELKEIIEEAAGVKRAKHEKEDSEKKLKEVKNEVDKIEYVEKELHNRVDYLRDESKKARLYRTLTTRIDTQRYMVLEYTINEKKGQKGNYDKKINELDKSIEIIQEEFSERQSNLSNVNDKREKIYAKVEEEKESNMLLFKSLEDLRLELANIKNKSSNLDTEYNEKQKRKLILEEDITGKSAVLEESKVELENIKNELIFKEKAKKEVEKEVIELEEKRSNTIENIRNKENQNRNFEVDKIKLNAENDDLEKRINLANVRINTISLEKVELEKDFVRVQDELAKAEKVNETNLEEKDKLNDKISETEIKLKELEIEKNKETNNLNEEKYKEENLLSKERANKNIIENNETFARSIKYILDKKENGVIGAFINLIDIPEGYEDAIQVLSGGSFQDIVTKTTDVAKKCIDELKVKQIGRASFLPIENVKVGKINNDLPKEKGVIGYARNIVKYDTSISRIVEFIYGNSIIVENLEVGTALLKKGYNDRIVTLQGDIITSRGRMTGGHLQKRKDEMIERKKELSSIKLKLETISKNKETVSLKVKEIEDGISKLKSTIEKDKVEFDKIDNNYKDYNKHFEEKRIEFNKYSRELNTLIYEEKDNTEFIEKQENKIKENKKILNNVDYSINENNKLLELLNKELTVIESSSDLANKLSELNIEYAILKEKYDNYDQRYTEINDDYTKLVDEKQGIDDFERDKDKEKLKLDSQYQTKSKEIEEKSTKNDNLMIQIRENEKKIKEFETLERSLISDVKDIETKIILQKNEHEKLVEAVSKVEKDIEYLEIELEDVNVEEVLQDEDYKALTEENEFQAIRRKLSMNEKTRMDIGSVNLASIEEFDKEEKRYNELVDQKRDLLESRESLLELIRNIEKDIVFKFTNAFEEINKNFEYMCKEILNGARGEIKINDYENLLETGLELSVKYKNKPEQTLMLLSGGEKSMLAVSFIMAIFMFKPSPFTFFDEIEAALDETNTKKIVGLLNGFISKSQFILITHNKETMKGSHRLYGVTMNKEIGESRIVSVDV